MFKRTVQQRRIQRSPDSEGEEPAPKRQKLEPAEAEPMEQGRPYQAFVENEASRFRQELTQSGSQAEPAPEEIRTRSTSERVPVFLDGRLAKVTTLSLDYTNDPATGAFAPRAVVAVKDAGLLPSRCRLLSGWTAPDAGFILTASFDGSRQIVNAAGRASYGNMVPAGVSLLSRCAAP